MHVAPGTGRSSLDAAGRAALSEILRERVARGGLPAIVAIVVNRDDVLFLDAAGKRDVAACELARPDTIFRIASMTKPVTSLAAMLLVEDGTLGLDDPVAKHLPDFVQRPVLTTVNPDGTFDTRPATRSITVRDLLTHTSGIAYPPFDARLRRLLAAGVTDADMPGVCDPGSRFAYGPGTAILGRLVAAVSGETLDAFCASRIFNPVGMTDTAYAVPADQASRVVTVHQRRADGRLEERPNPATIASRGRGDDGLFSTARDYGAFMQLFLNRGRSGERRVASERTIDLMVTNQIGELMLAPIDSADPLTALTFPVGGSKDKFGFGFQVETPPSANGMRSAGSLSWSGIFNTHFWIDPARGIAAALLMQLLPVNDPAVVDLLISFERTVYQSLRS